jgi:thiamine-phosphate pyrophosphorylase
LLQRARRLRDLTREHSALLMINDRPDIARLAGADGVHVGQGDMSVAEARHVAGGAVLVGKSTHSREEFDAALAEEPDYVAVGPMFASPTKPEYGVAGPDLLASVADRTQLPLVGIGGITAENAAQVLAAGASCVCVCSAVIGAADVALAVRGLLRAVESA